MISISHLETYSHCAFIEGRLLALLLFGKITKKEKKNFAIDFRNTLILSKVALLFDLL